MESASALVSKPSSPPRVGPAGWSYPDWQARVYPPHPSRRFDPLLWIARFFSTIEVNSSFYHIPPPRNAESWVRRLREVADFRFAVKLHRSFTHDDPQISSGALADLEKFLEPLAESGRLGPILAQFPWSFRRSEKHLAYLQRLSEKLAPHSLVFELRHGSWGDDSGIVQLHDSKLCVVSVDQPQLSDSLPPVLQSSGELLYLRLHGRNRENWFQKNAGRDQRYDYCYSLAELTPWIDAFRKSEASASESYIITNNHFQGQAVVNALQIRALLGEDVAEFPSWLQEEFPEIKEDLKRAGASNPQPLSFREEEPSTKRDRPKLKATQHDLFDEDP